jgi:uncharacterized protein (TIRG00374 family)
MRLSRSAGLALRVALSLALLALVLWRAHLREVAGVLAGISLPWLLAAFSLLFLGTVIGALRWRILIAVHGTPPPVLFLTRTYLYTVFLNNFFPSTVGADALRAAQVPRSSIPLSVSLVTVVVERLMGVVALVLMTVVFFPAVSARFGLAIPWVPLAVAALAGLAMAWRLATSRGLLERLRGRAAGRPLLERGVALLGKVVTPLQGFLAAPRDLLAVFGLTLVIQLNVILFQYFLARALGVDLPMTALFAVIPLTRLLIALPLTVNGVGLREGTMTFFLGAWGVAPAAAVAMAWLDYGLVLVEGLVGWLLWVAAGARVKPPAGENQ